MVAVSWCDQFSLVLRRNYLLKLRQRGDTTCEILFPLVFFAILLSLKNGITPQHHPEVRNQLPVSLSNGVSSMFGFASLYGAILYAPGPVAANNFTHNKDIDAIIAAVQRPIPFPVFIPFADRESLNQFYYNRPPQNASTRVWAGVVFEVDGNNGGTTADGESESGDRLPDHIRYSISINGGLLPSSTDNLVLYDWDENVISLEYIGSGFVTLQNAINSAILELRWNEAFPADGGAAYWLDSTMLQFPTRAYDLNPFQPILQKIGGLYFIIGFFPVVNNLLSNLVFEREKKLTEGMKMMGLRGSVLTASWYVTYVVITTIPVLITSIIAETARFLPNTNGFALLILLLAYMQSLLALTFLMSHLFRLFNASSRTAGHVGSLLVFFMVLPMYPAQDAPNVHVMALPCMLSPTAFSLGFLTLTDGDQNENGVNWDNLVGGTVGGGDLPYWLSVAMLCGDAIAYAIAAWYFGNVLPGEYGSTQYSWYYVLDPRYWCRLCCCCCGCGERCCPDSAGSGDPSDRSSVPSVGIDTHNLLDVGLSEVGGTPGHQEAVHKELAANAAIRIVALRKVFENRLEWCSRWCGLSNSGSGKRSAAGAFASSDAYGGLPTADDESTAGGGGGGGGGSNYSGSGRPIVALDNVHLDMYEGQILALLGHNGAGKSTLIAVLTGLLTPSAGSVSMYGIDLSRINDIRRILSVCPQHDIVFNQLTVREHLQLYAGLKGIHPSLIDREIKIKVSELGLEERLDSQVQTLSGGERRKLSVGIALLGDSKVIFLDEPTSGMDPYSRRLVWTLLQRYAKGRVIILTTHYMDEADLLGDRIAILSRGAVQCVGSSLFLKNRFGLGYSLTIVPLLSTNPITTRAQISTLVKEKIPGAQILDSSDSAAGAAGMPGAGAVAAASRAGTAAPVVGAAAPISFVLPLERVALFAPLLEELEQNASHYGIQSYGISLTSLEEVFLNLAESQSDDMSKLGGGLLQAAAGGAKPIITPNGTVVSGSSHTPTASSSLLGGLSATPTPNTYSSSAQRAKAAFNLAGAAAAAIATTTAARRGSLPGADAKSGGGSYQMRVVGSDEHAGSAPNSARGGGGGSGHHHHYSSKHLIPDCGQQFKAIWTRKWITAKRNWRSLSLSIAFPVICALIILSVCKNLQTGILSNTSPPVSLSAPDYLSSELGVAGADFLMQARTAALFANVPTFDPVMTSNNSLGGLIDWLIDPNPANTFAALYTSGINTPSIVANQRVYITAMTFQHNTSAIHVMPIILNTVANALLQQLSTPPTHLYGVECTSTPFDYDAPSSQASTAPTLMALFGAFGFGFLPVAFAYALVKEKESGAKRQQMLAGLKPLPFWFAHLLFDSILIWIPVAATFGLFFAFDNELLMGDYFYSGLLLFLAYGAQSCTVTYFYTFLFKSPLSIQQVLGSLYGFATLILVLVATTLVTTWYGNMIIFILIVLFPSFGLGWGLYTLSDIMNNNNTCFAVLGCPSPFDAAGMLTFPQIGQYFTTMFIAAFGAWIIVLILDAYEIEFIGCRACNNNNCCGAQTRCCASSDPNLVTVEAEDEDVGRERRRVEDAVAGDTTPLTSLNASGGANGNGIRSRSGSNVVPAAREDPITILDLHKVYKSKVADGSKDHFLVAVHRLTLGVPDGVCFGLLGSNGAGKSTTLNMLTSELAQTSGDAFLNGTSILAGTERIYRDCAYCPQNDPLFEELTPREHLWHYARLKGIREIDIPAAIQRRLDAFELNADADRNVKLLSPGLTRKLTLAISLIGYPRILLLDEPSRGLDPVARRSMWDVVRAEMNDRSCAVIVTTHSMEEADQLCSRIGILVNGRLRCIGTSQHLKSKYGSGYHIELKTRDDPVYIERLKQLVMSLSGDRATCDENFAGKLRFTIPRPDASDSDDNSLPSASAGVASAGDEKSAPGLVQRNGKTPGGGGGGGGGAAGLNTASSRGPELPLSKLFRTIERERDNYAIEDYSISQTTLEQVFLSFARHQHQQQRAAQ